MGYGHGVRFHLSHFALAWSCASCAVRRADPSRVVALQAPVNAVQAPEATVQEAAPWSHREGFWPGPVVLQMPTVRWELALPGPVVRPLAVDHACIYAVAAGNVYCIGRNGEKRWTARADVVGVLAPHEEGLVVSTGDNQVILLEPETGALKETIIDDVRARSAAIRFQDAWVVVTADGFLRSSDGDQNKLTDAPVSGIASDGERIFLGTGDGQALAVDRSGIIWEADIGGPAIGHPVVGPNHVFLSVGEGGDESGGVVALEREEGRVIWRAALGHAPATAPALGEILVVPGRAGELSALDPSHGGTRWRFPGTGGFTVTPALGDQVVYAGNADGRMHRVDLHDGGEAWSVSMGATITGDPLLVDGMLVVGLTDGRVVALQ